MSTLNKSIRLPDLTKMESFHWYVHVLPGANRYSLYLPKEYHVIVSYLPPTMSQHIPSMDIYVGFKVL